MKINKLIAAGLLGLIGLSSVSAAPLKLGYSDWPGYTVMEIAKQKGWFKDAGLDVEMVWFEYSPSIDAFAADPFVETIVGKELKDEFIRYKRVEWTEYHQSVSQWEIDRYARLF